MITPRSQLALKTAAFITSVMVVVFIAVFAIGEGVPNPFGQPPRVMQLFACMLGLVIGLMIGFIRPMTGGLIAAACLLAANIIEVSANGRVLGGAFPLFWVPAVLLVLAGAAARANTHGATLQRN